MNQCADNYCIRPDYTPNFESRTLDTNEEVFWRSARIRTSQFYQWHVYDYVAQLVRERNLRTVLDVGCGPATKLMSCIAPLAQVYGIDQQSAVTYCKNTYSSGTFMVDDFENPRLEVATDFDVIICSDVIEHIHDPDVLLAYIKRFCRKETLVVLSTPDRERLRGKRALVCTKAEHVREWSAPEFAAYLKSRGFEIVEHTHLPPVKTALNSLFFMHLAIQFARLRPYRYNQMAVCRLSV